MAVAQGIYPPALVACWDAWALANKCEVQSAAIIFLSHISQRPSYDVFHFLELYFRPFKDTQIVHVESAARYIRS